MFEANTILAIEGLGGTGKTQFAAKYIDELIFQKDSIIWLDGSAQSSFDVFVENSGYGNLLIGKGKTDLALFSGFKDAIERDKRIIFWDNYNDYIDHSFSKFLSFANYYLCRSKVVLITRIATNIKDITALPTYRLEGLHNNGTDYAKKMRDSSLQYQEITDTDIEKICSAVEGHPLAIEFALSLMSRGKNAEDIILHLPQLSGIKKVEEFSKRLFFDIFNSSSTTGGERDCLLRCSVFKEKISEDEIRYLYNGKDIFNLIDGLIDKCLITARMGFYEMHPLVRSFCYEKLESKDSIHKGAASYFISLRTIDVIPSLEEKIYYHLMAAEEWLLVADQVEMYGKTLFSQGHLNFLRDIINKLRTAGVWRDMFYILMGDILQVKSMWSEALENFESGIKSDSIEIKAESIIKCGEITFRQGNISNSLTYFEKAYDFTDKSNLLKEKARALNDIGLVLLEFFKPDLAKVKFDQALELREKLGDRQGIAETLNNIGNYHQSQNSYLKSLRCYYQSRDIAIECGDRVALALYYMSISHAERELKKYSEALVANALALKIYEEFGTQSEIAFIHNSNALIFIEQNKYDEAQSSIDLSQSISSEINDRKNMGLAHNTIGFLNYNKKNFSTALLNFLQGIWFFRQIGSKWDEHMISSWIKNICKIVGKDEFIKISDEFLTKGICSIDGKEFINEPFERLGKKIGRNQKVVVRYNDSNKSITDKFKNVEEDLKTGNCVLVHG